MVVSSCERTAVDVSAPAEASSSVEAEDTVSTISPTAPSKASAILIMSALRCSRRDLVLPDLGFRLVARLLLGVDLEGLHRLRDVADFVGRPRPGSTIAKLPFASSIIAAFIADSGLETDRPMNNPADQHRHRDHQDGDFDHPLDAVALRDVQPLASTLMPLTDFDTASITGSIAENDSDIAFSSSASFSACSIQAWKSR